MECFYFFSNNHILSWAKKNILPLNGWILISLILPISFLKIISSFILSKFEKSIERKDWSFNDVTSASPLNSGNSSPSYIVIALTAIEGTQ